MHDSVWVVIKSVNEGHISFVKYAKSQHLNTVHYLGNEGRWWASAVRVPELHVQCILFGTELQARVRHCRLTRHDALKRRPVLIPLDCINQDHAVKLRPCRACRGNKIVQRDTWAMDRAPCWYCDRTGMEEVLD